MVWRYNKSGVSYNADFTITTLSKSITQRDLEGGAVVAPFFFGSQGEGRVRNQCIPPAVVAGAIPTGSLTMGTAIDREACGTVDIDTRFPIIDPTTVLYAPYVVPPPATQSMEFIPSDSSINAPALSASYTLSGSFISSSYGIFAPSVALAGGYYTHVLSASNPANSSSLHVGSFYLEADTYTTIGAVFTEIYADLGGSNAHVELKRNTTGVTLLTLTNDNTAGPTWSYITSSEVVVSTSDWYDIYISASGNPATASIMGVYYEL